MGWFPSCKMEVCVGWGAEDSGLTTFSGQVSAGGGGAGGGLGQLSLGSWLGGWYPALTPRPVLAPPSATSLTGPAGPRRTRALGLLLSLERPPCPLQW